MRILHAAHAYAPVIGGAEILCKRVGEELVKRGHQVRVVVPRFASPEVFYSVGIDGLDRTNETLNGVEVERLPYGGAGYRIAGLAPDWLSRRVERRRRPAWNQTYQRHLGKQLQEWTPEVVVALPHLFPNVQAFLNLRRSNRFPLVVVPLLHEGDADRSTFATALGHADGVIALTRHEATRLTEAFGVEAHRVHVCRPGVDLPPGPDPVGHPRSQTVAYLGRLTPQKGIGLLVSAMSHVWERQPGTRLILAGATTPETARIELLAAEANGPVTVLRNIPNRRKHEVLTDAALVVLPSQRESFGLSILESWAHAAPVIALDLPVMSEIVTSDAGVLIEPDNPLQLGSAITELLADEGRRRAMAAAGRSKVEGMSWAASAADWEQAYTAAIGATRA